MRRLLPACLMVLFSVWSLAQTAKPAGNTIKDKYHVIEVDNFDIQEGVKLPPDYFASLQDELVKQLTESHQFEAVLRPQQQPPKEDMPVLRLTGIVTGYKEGSRAKRYFGGYGAGSTQIFAHAKYLDRATGETVIEGEVIGTLTGGLFGGDSKKVIPQFAKAVVTTTKLMLLKKPEPANREAGEPAPPPEPAAATERTTLEISSGGLDANQKALNELAAKGFRITNYASTGKKSATLTLEKGADPSQTYTYLMFHTKLVGTLEKELNKSAAEGYRLVPHTLAFLGGFFLIAEKPGTAPSARYEYRVHQTMRMSSAEKNIKEDQATGFVLIDTTQVLNQSHLIVLERETNQQEPAS
ncbi:MAG TPA: DUF4410 domain-containing protein [Terracidiphilus sp.]|nr:DUF4410 domain-containing protein [Terracidiphilus sp.]